MTDSVPTACPNSTLDQHVVELAAGQVLFSQGDVGDRAYVVRSGQIEIVRRLQEQDVVLAVEGPGTIIGEMALIDDQPRSATVRAVEPTTLTVVSKEAFQFHLSRTDPVIRILLERFTSIIRTISAQNARLNVGLR